MRDRWHYRSRTSARTGWAAETAQGENEEENSDDEEEVHRRGAPAGSLGINGR